MSELILRTAVIGAGLRAASYFTNLPEHLKSCVQLVAIADPNPRHRTAFVEKYAAVCSNELRFYDSGAQLMENEPEIDAMVIGSPNHSHVADACPAIERRIPTLLEKPVAISVEQCRQIWQTWCEAGQPPVTVGFVLRATPFYQRIREIVASGVLGQVLTLDADENVGTSTTRQMRSGWRRFEEYCGGVMVEKCSHDFDLLRMIASSEAVRVSSFAARTHFVANSPHVEARFEKLPAQTEALDYGDAATRRLFTDDTSGSMYEDEGDLPDHQSVIIEWENGLTTCFTAAFAQLRPTRKMRIAGTAGNLSGDAEDSRLILETAPEEVFQRDEIEITHDASGHHGGDGNTAAHFWNSAWSMVASPEETPDAPLAGLREGIEAVLIAIAAQQAARTGTVVDVRAMRQQVFGA